MNTIDVILKLKQPICSVIGCFLMYDINQIRFSATLIIDSTSIKEQAQNLSYG